MNSLLKNITLVFLCTAITGIAAFSQPCTNRYSLITVKGSTFENLTKLYTTKQQEIIAAGELADFNQAGHLMKFSGNGNIVWSGTYSVDFFSFYPKDFFNHVRFNDIISTSDGGFAAAGSVAEFNYNASVFKDTVALISKFDKYGSPVWTKIFKSYNALQSTANIAFTSVIQTGAGDFVGYIATDNGIKTTGGGHSYDKVICLDGAGNTKWSTLLFTYLFDAGGFGLNFKRAITQAADQSIIIGRAIHETGPPATGFSILPGNIHFLSLDNITGKIKWETNYAYAVPANDSFYTPDMFCVKQSAKGKFSFISNLYMPGPSGLVKKPVQIITSTAGQVEQVLTFGTADQSSSEVIDAINDDTENQFLLLKNNDKKALIKINGSGQLLLNKGYNNNHAGITPKTIAANKNGIYIHGSDFTSFFSELFVTDTAGSIDCVVYPAAVVTGQGTLNPPGEIIFTDLSTNYDDRFLELGHRLKKEDYPLQQSSSCLQANSCCRDTVDKTNIININICAGSSYMLPDSMLIQDSGMYYVTFKTALGCDSTRFYQVTVDKNVDKLSLGNDTCLAGSSHITIKATDGFGKYFWMNSMIADSSSLKITQPGLYYVSVNNICGSKTDSIQVFDSCDYKIYMPNAFSPNGNGVNDNFRISPFNKNKLIRFSIYNRWGKIIFNTTDPMVGWDGSYKNESLDTGSFIYYIEMEGITGQRLVKKGYVTLIR